MVALAVLVAVLALNLRRGPDSLQRQAKGELIALADTPPTLQARGGGSGTAEMKPIAYDWPGAPGGAELAPSEEIRWSQVPRLDLAAISELRFASSGVAPSLVEITAYRHAPALDSVTADPAATCKLSESCAFRAAGSDVRVVPPESIALDDYRYVVVSAFFFGEDADNNPTTVTASWGIELTS
jgi:hypothetical protein